MRKGGWRYLDTGQVLIESACSVDRVEEAISTLLPMLPEMQYFRFNPVDERCDTELDETDPTIWLKLEGATDEYIQKNHQSFENVRLLLPFQHEGSLGSQLPKRKESNEGWRRNVLLVEALHRPDFASGTHHVRALESFCEHNGIRLSLVQGVSGTVKTVPPTLPTPASPLFTGSFPMSSLVFSASIGQRIGRIDAVPPLSLDGQLGKAAASPLTSPQGLRQLSLPARSLHEKLLNSPQVGVVHLALQNATDGLIVRYLLLRFLNSLLCFSDLYLFGMRHEVGGYLFSWHNDVFVVAEPGKLAEKFLQNVKLSLLSTLRGHRRKVASLLANISTISDLVAFKSYFHIGGIVHRYLGRQTLVLEDNQEIGSYMFRGTVPSMHLTPDDVRCMVGAWRDRIIICTGTYGPTPALIKAFLDSGVKAVICPSTEPPEYQVTTFDGSGEFHVVENVKFEIGVDEVEEDDNEPATASALSDWEDGDAEKIGGDYSLCFLDDDEELSHFVCQFYDSVFWEGASINAALQHALASHRRLGYACHLPTIQ